KPMLPAPFATKSAGNAPEAAKPPAGFLPTVPKGFRVNVFATNFKYPRWLTIAPNGDIFLADSGAGEIVVMRDLKNTGGAQEREVFVDGQKEPFGIVFHEDYVYVGNTNEIVRFRYDPKTSKRLGEKEHLMDLPTGGHSTRAVAFSPDGKHLFVSVGSNSNIDTGEDPRRAAVTICDPDGKNARLYATGLRNPVGLALEPVTGEVWTTVNERDRLGDDLPPDYFTSLKDGGFYGWPYSYIGDNVDTRVKQEHPERVARAIIPDVLLGAHVAPIQFTFYTGKQFPESCRGDLLFAKDAHELTGGMREACSAPRYQIDVARHIHLPHFYFFHPTALDFPMDAHARHDGHAHAHLHEPLDAFDRGHFDGHVERGAVSCK